MKKFIMFVSAITLVIGLVSTGSALSLVDSNSNLVYDENTGKYWYRDLSDFTGMNFAEQCEAIDVMNWAYQAPFHDWHVASEQEMQELWSYGADEIMDNFLPSSTQWGVALPSDGMWQGRYGDVHWTCPDIFCWVAEPEPYHDTAEIYWKGDSYSTFGHPRLISTLDGSFAYDSWYDYGYGVWVVTENPHPLSENVPEPASLLLVGVGLMVLAAIRRHVRGRAR